MAAVGTVTAVDHWQPGLIGAYSSPITFGHIKFLLQYSRGIGRTVWIIHWRQRYAPAGDGVATSLLLMQNKEHQRHLDAVIAWRGPYFSAEGQSVLHFLLR